ncbi:MAG: sulfatase-like hydrolase/transferase, partial [Bacteroidales bacterium]|nr:sulfatase-like hydrolase/transferase [Bacteroidales bacterium]
DLDLIAPLKRFIETSPSNKLFIVLHSYGSHFNYRDRLPADDIYFTPDENSEANVENRPQLINAYDNTIALTDRMLDHVLISLGKQPGVAAMVYTSDHGEDIFDDARHQFLHASPCPSFYQLRVPFLVWLSDSYRARYPQADAQLTRHARARIPSNSTFFPTALDIAGVVTPKADATYSVASPRFKEHKRVYLNDHNEAVALTASGFTPEDTRLLSALDH